MQQRTRLLYYKWFNIAVYLGSLIREGKKWPRKWPFIYHNHGYSWPPHWNLSQVWSGAHASIFASSLLCPWLFLGRKMCVPFISHWVAAPFSTCPRKIEMRDNCICSIYFKLRSGFYHFVKYKWCLKVPFVQSGDFPPAPTFGVGSEDFVLLALVVDYRIAAEDKRRTQNVFTGSENSLVLVFKTSTFIHLGNSAANS